MTGAWNVTVSKNMPQKVATAMARLSETLLGAEYTPLFYLGSQVVNGMNHAVLAEQLITTGKDTKNIVVIVFNEKPGEMELSLVGIERILESGSPLGGTVIDVKTEVPEEALTVWADAFEGYVGLKITPLALLGTQAVNGTNYMYLAESEGVVLNPTKEVNLVVINDKMKKVSITDMLANQLEASLGYSFTW